MKNIQFFECSITGLAPQNRIFVINDKFSTTRVSVTRPKPWSLLTPQRDRWTFFFFYLSPSLGSFNRRRFSVLPFDSHNESITRRLCELARLRPSKYIVKRRKSEQKSPENVRRRFAWRYRWNDNSGGTWGSGGGRPHCVAATTGTERITRAAATADK